MAMFTDNAGRAWNVHIDVGAIRRVRTAAGVLLTDLVSGNLYRRVFLEPALVAEIAWGIVQPQAAGMKVGEDQFFEAMRGDVLDAARIAILDALPDFIPGRLRPTLAAMREAETKALGRSDGPAPAAPTPPPPTPGSSRVNSSDGSASTAMA